MAFSKSRSDNIRLHSEPPAFLHGRLLLLLPGWSVLLALLRQIQILLLPLSAQVVVQVRIPPIFV